MLGSEFDNNFVFLPSIGPSGGIFISWRSRLGYVAASRVDSYSATVQFSPKNGDAWWLTVVYGPQGNDKKLLSCKSLEVLEWSVWDLD
jgi:hypothetical protein